MSAPSARAHRRRRWFGLLTVLGVARRGFFIPHRYAGAVPPAGARAPYAALEALFAGRAGAFRQVLDWIGAVEAALLGMGAAPAPAPRWEQAWFPRLDAAVAYAMVRHLAPRNIVEIGAGHSTRFLARAIADGGLDTRFLAIDPAPRAVVDGLAVELCRQTVQDADPEIFARLGPGDLLTIDSSHILVPGSDVDLLFGRVLPALPAGALVHIHDVFLPDDYPPAWEWRGYNEQLGVLPLLLGGGWEAMFASHYVVTRMAEALGATAVARLPLAAGAHETSLWLRKL
ncbi:MAG: class I SAM-dependent methyltransferase [Kiloniellaceae bacterium]